MADLGLERKRPNLWRWIVLLLLVAVVVWAIVELFGVERSTVVDEDVVGSLGAPPIHDSVMGPIAAEA